MKSLKTFFIISLVTLASGCTSSSNENLMKEANPDSSDAHFHFGPGPDVHFHFGPGPVVEWDGDNAE